MIAQQPTSLIVQQRRIATKYFEDEEALKAVVTHEVARLTDSQPAELGFVLPSVTIVAATQDAEIFVRRARRELGQWHRWLNSCLGAGNKRRSFRIRKAMDQVVMISGILIRDGMVDNFADYVRAFIRNKHLATSQPGNSPEFPGGPPGTGP